MKHYHLGRLCITSCSPIGFHNINLPFTTRYLSLLKLHLNFFFLEYLVKCLSPTGKFADPTNEYGYIRCTAGSAKRVPCAVGEKWEDETKSCERKGKVYN